MNLGGVSRKFLVTGGIHRIYMAMTQRNLPPLFRVARYGPVGSPLAIQLNASFGGFGGLTVRLICGGTGKISAMSSSATSDWWIPLSSDTIVQIT